jgi:Sulfotransferase family
MVISGDDLLTEARVLEAAEEATGLTDWGDDDSFRIGLRVFLEALAEMDAPPELREAGAAHSIKLLSDRLHWVADERAHPEILDIPVDRPLIVIGMPRTGTTILYDLLACDSAARAPLYWEAADVWPAPEAATWHTDPRIAAAQAGLDELLSVVPEVADMLPMGATLPAECNRFMPYHFYGNELGAAFGVPSHSQWVATGTAPGLYRTHRRVLQQLTWKGPRGRWTLKSPIHLYNLGPLVAEYPDACLVWTHRALEKIFASLVDLLAATRRAGGNEPDRAELAAETLDIYGAALERGLASRDDPSVEGRILDIAFQDTATDPIGTVERVHHHFDLPFTDDHAARMHQFIKDHPKGDHKYSPPDCGFDATMLRARFPAYYERFGEFI